VLDDFRNSIIFMVDRNGNLSGNLLVTGQDVFEETINFFSDKVASN
jgi:hypothetical protein